MTTPLAAAQIVFTPLPAAYFGAGALGALPGIVRGTGGRAVALVTDATLAGTPVVAADTAALAAGGTAVTVVAVGGGSVLDAAKGIALAAVNPQRGRALDYRGTFARAALPLVAVPTTAGTGAETNAFGV